MAAKCRQVKMSGIYQDSGIDSETETERKRDELRAQQRAGRWDTSNVRGTGRVAVSGVGWDGNGVRRGRRRKGGRTNKEKRGDSESNWNRKPVRETFAK